MKKISFILIAVFFISKMSFSKNLVQGQIIDETSSLPIEYASLFLANHQQIGTISNSEGFFILSIPDTIKGEEILITHLNYEVASVRLPQKDSIIEIQLTPAIITLATIEVRPENYAANLVTKAYNKMATQEVQFRGKGFYTQKSRMANNYFEVLEAMVNVSFSTKNILNWEVTQGRYAIDPDFPLRFKNFSSLTRYAPTYREEIHKLIIPLYKNAGQFYSFQVAKIIQKKQSKQNIVVIDFIKLEGVKLPILEGQLFIDETTCNVLRIKGKAENFQIMKFPRRIKIQKPAYYYDITYKVDKDKMILERIFVKSSSSISSKRVSVLNGSLDIESLFVCYDYSLEDGKQHSKETSSKLNDFKTIQKASYNPQFWDQNEVVKRNPTDEAVIQKLEERNFFVKSH